MPCAVSVDIGTTGTKAVLYDQSGKPLHDAYVSYPINSPKQGFREQDPDNHFEAVVSTLSQVAQKARDVGLEIAFVSFSAMMHGLFPVNERGEPMAPCMLWNDARSEPYVKADRESGLGLSQYLRTGTPCHPMSPSYKLMGLREHKPELYKAYKFISVKEYVFYKFFGRFLIDYSVASATGLFNLEASDWDDLALERLGLDRDRFSKPVDTTHIISCEEMCGELREKIGLSKQTVFVIGASDGCLSNLGSQAIQPGEAAVTIGTSGAVRVVFDRPVTDESGRVFCYYLSKNKYVVGGPLNNGGIAYRWFRDMLSAENSAVFDLIGASECDVKAVSASYDHLNEYVINTPPGSRGLLFLPFLFGERAPYWNASLRAAFIGLTDAHGVPEMTRSVIEGICLAVANVFKTLDSLAGPIKTVRADGGFASLEEWIRILCDCLDTPLYIMDGARGPLTGAYYLGLYACGYIKRLEDAAGISGEAPYLPRGENRDVYNRLLGLYRQSVNALTPVLEGLGDLL